MLPLRPVYDNELYTTLQNNPGPGCFDYKVHPESHSDRDHPHLFLKQGAKSIPHFVIGAVEPQEVKVGKLYISESGYVYNVQPRPVLWLKFLGLGLILTVSSLSTRILHDSNNSHEVEELQQTWKQAKTAWKALVCWDGKSLYGSVNDFALQELEFNGGISQEMGKPRSKRFADGVYLARCMQPLFHAKDYTDTVKNEPGYGSDEYRYLLRCEKYAFKAIQAQSGNCSKNRWDRGGEVHYFKPDELACCPSQMKCIVYIAAAVFCLPCVLSWACFKDCEENA